MLVVDADPEVLPLFATFPADEGCDLHEATTGRGRLDAVRSLAKPEKAPAEIRTLRGLIPICASCKSIRDDEGYWNHVDTYFSEDTDAVFSHGICPECADRLYPRYCRKGNEK
jgi:hypothetical protein